MFKKLYQIAYIVFIVISGVLQIFGALAEFTLLGAFVQFKVLGVIEEFKLLGVFVSDLGFKSFESC